MATNKKDTDKGAPTNPARKGGGASAPRSGRNGSASKTGNPGKDQAGNPYAGLTKVAGKVRVRDPYTSESW
jgi:hypothetical protein